MKPENHLVSKLQSESPVDSAEVVNSKSAIDEYYDDILGSLADDPLKKLQEAEQDAIAKERHSAFLDHDSKKDSLGFELQHKAVTPKPKLKPKRKNVSQHKAEFAEPNRKPLTSLIIPAAFPKLAPKATVSEPRVSQKEVVASRQSVEVKESVKVNKALKSYTECDSKTALALLEAKKSRLSEKQRLRLEAKLKTKAKVNTKPESNVKTKVDVKAENKVQAKVETQVKTETKHRIEPKAKPSVKVKPQAKVDPIELSEENQATLVTANASLKPLGSWLGNGRPQWAQDRFECLLFTVAGLKLAVPLISLGAIYKIENELTPLVGRADWFMGLYRHTDRNINVVDTAKLVMPDRWSELVKDSYEFIIRLGGNNWGLACDAVHESIQLAPSQVKWRSERTKRAWLSGTVIDHMCALLDVEALGGVLHQEATNKSGNFSS